MPKTDTDDPKRAKLRTDNELPRCKKSRTLALEAKRDIPATDTVDPRRE
jgi:hypothetical protein